jgi:hypothetical protein
MFKILDRNDQPEDENIDAIEIAIAIAIIQYTPY